ncbi:hypothetical protein CJF30_00002459 [Rutstroemia sp. NJR-2017a BBW]|nr:hypothetical protein CJF30_00002459 [Rutstroemia sp. NJR-2017a BBW]
MLLLPHLLPLGLFLSAALGHRINRRQGSASADSLAIASEPVGISNGQSLMTSTVPPAPLKTIVVGNLKVLANTTAAKADAKVAVANIAETVDSKVLVIARDSVSAYSVWSGLNDLGIPYQVLIVPSGGVTLPQLNSSSTSGNFGLIVVLSEVSYSYPNVGYQSALTADQWQQLYNYQLSFHVRLVRLDSYPSAAFGTQALGSCCNDKVEQLVSVSDTSGFPNAGLKIATTDRKIHSGAGVSTLGLYHYPTVITNSTIAKEFLQLGPSSDGQYTNKSTAGVINNINGREQVSFVNIHSGHQADMSRWYSMCHSPQTGPRHQSISSIHGSTGAHEAYSGLFHTNVSDIYKPAGTTYRIGTADLAQHITFMNTINSKLNPGSKWWIEVGHNGNGNIEQSDSTDATGTLCKPGPIEYGEQIDTPLEWVKPIGSGTNLWPASPSIYPNYTAACLNKDTLKTWWATPANLNAFSHVSHTFTHEDQNNATYADIYKEITWNQAWLAASGIASATKFSPKGLIPPAITGLHNGDALRAWSDSGITHAIGDNTRPALLNPNNEHWPLISTVAANGFDGIQITPRWATNIYYNCDLPDCTVAEWIATSAGSGDINTLLNVEKQTNVRHLLSLHHDAFMFHQANLRYTGAASYTINGVTSTLSLFEAWVETVTQEFVRLVDWPLLTYKHDDLATLFANRMTRDACKPGLTYEIDATAATITGVTVTSNGNTCSVPVPVTLPGAVTDTQGATSEKVGNDPLTLWVPLKGQPVTYTLSTPIKL